MESPRRTSSPDCTGAREMRLPLMNVPFAEPSSTISKPDAAIGGAAQRDLRLAEREDVAKVRSGKPQQMERSTGGRCGHVWSRDHIWRAGAPSHRIFALAAELADAFRGERRRGNGR